MNTCLWAYHVNYYCALCVILLHGEVVGNSDLPNAISRCNVSCNDVQ